MATEETTAEAAPKAAKKAAPAKKDVFKKAAKKPAVKKAAAPKGKPAAKKAVAKPAAKKVKAAAKKPAKKAEAGTFRTDYPAKARVKVMRKDGAWHPGRVTSVERKSTGHFINVNIGTEAKPFMIAARPAMVKGF